MNGEFRGAPDVWEFVVFIAAAETHGAAAAAQRLERDYGKAYTRQSVQKILQKVETWVGTPVLTRQVDRKLYLTPRGQELLEWARKVVTHYRLMRGQDGPTALPRLACLPHHTPFVAMAEDQLFEQCGAHQVTVEYLPQNQRGESAFHQHAVALLRNNEYQVIVGPRVTDPTFESRTLYHAQLEAMMARSHPADELSLTELVKEYRMMVPPNDMRSRKLLEDSIVQWGIDDPGQQFRVAAETYETATSVMRLRNEHHGRSRDRRVVVVPSDVALPYKEGMEFGGRHADRFKWVPIYHDDGAGTTHLLRMEVCVTVRRGPNGRLRHIVSALESAVKELGQAPDHDGLCGAPFRRRGREPSRPSVPRPR